MQLTPENLNLTITMPGLRVTAAPTEQDPDTVTVTAQFPDPTVPAITATAAYDRHGAVIFQRDFRLGDPQAGYELLTSDEDGPRASSVVSVWHGQAHANARHERPEFKQEVLLNGKRTNLPLVFNLDWYQRWALVHLAGLLVAPDGYEPLTPDQLSQVLQRLPRDRQPCPRQVSDRARMQVALPLLQEPLTVDAFARWYASLPVQEEHTPSAGI